MFRNELQAVFSSTTNTAAPGFYTLSSPQVLPSFPVTSSQYPQALGPLTCFIPMISPPPPVPPSSYSYSKNVSFPKAPLTPPNHMKIFRYWTGPPQHLLSTSSRPRDPRASPFPLTTIYWLHIFLDQLKSNHPPLCSLLANTFNSFTPLFFHLVPLRNPYSV